MQLRTQYVTLDKLKQFTALLFLYFWTINPFMPGGNKKVTHT